MKATLWVNTLDGRHWVILNTVQCNLTTGTDPALSWFLRAGLCKENDVVVYNPSMLNEATTIVLYEAKSQEEATAVAGKLKDRLRTKVKILQQLHALRNVAVPDIRESLKKKLWDSFFEINIADII